MKKHYLLGFLLLLTSTIGMLPGSVYANDAIDTDGDGYVGECWEDVDLDGILTPPPFGATDQINTDLGTTCTVCGGNGGFWLYDDSDTGEFNALDGDGIVDDDAAYGKTNGNGTNVLKN